ncbi:MAG: GNAT family N-acetyltransferase [Candidatus Hodarchaeota archaeon]
MDVQELIRLQLELECKNLNEAGDIVPIPCPNPDDIPRILVIKHKDGYNVFFRYDLPSPLRASLTTVSPRVLFTDQPRVKSLLSQYNPCNEIWLGKSYVFPPELGLSSHLEVIHLPEQSSCAIIIDGENVSTCSSARENHAAGEAWTFTQPEYRRRGYGKLVTAAWGQRLREKGKVPFYSHLGDNAASEGIARSLGLIQFISAVGYV